MAADRARPSGGRRRVPAAATAVACVLAVHLVFSAVRDSPEGAFRRPPEPVAAPEGGAPGPDRPAGGPIRSLPPSEPVEVEIPAIGLRVDDFVRLGLRRDGGIEAPGGYGEVGWYENGPSPGQAGAAVIGGHVDSETGPAVFHRLEELRPGDTVVVERADGGAALFTVYGVQRYPKEGFPTRRVYGPTGGHAEIRLLTCGGEFDEATQNYRDNIVVYARMSSSRPARVAVTGPAAGREAGVARSGPADPA